MKTVETKELRECDVCRAIVDMVTGDEESIEPGIYDSPTRKEDPITRGQWANLCSKHFERHGLDTTVTTRLVYRP